MNKIIIDNVEVVLSHPLTTKTDWIGQDEPMRQLLACWLVIDPNDLPL
ncbi:MAG: ATPase, partial [Fibrobacter sp.]|nr:ATPase [Fibrobacter sp.]